MYSASQYLGANKVHVDFVAFGLYGALLALKSGLYLTIFFLLVLFPAWLIESTAASYKSLAAAENG